MTDQQFEAFLQECSKEVKVKQSELVKNYALDKYTKYIFSQGTQTIEFKDELNESSLIFEMVCIGTWDQKEEVWEWAWANQTLSEEVRQAAMPLKKLEEITGYELFGKEGFKCEEVVARDLAYMGVHQLEAKGVYRIVVEENYVFLALMDVK